MLGSPCLCPCRHQYQAATLLFPLARYIRALRSNLATVRSANTLTDTNLATVNRPACSPMASISVMLGLTGQRRSGRRAPGRSIRGQAPEPDFYSMHVSTHRTDTLRRVAVRCAWCSGLDPHQNPAPTIADTFHAADHMGPCHDMLKKFGVQLCRREQCECINSCTSRGG